MTINKPIAPRGENRFNSTGSFREKLRVAAIFAALVAAYPCIGNAQPASGTGAAAQGSPVTQDQVDSTVHVCSSCHGFGGRSVSPTFPRLAGQQKDYLIAQLKAFRDKTRDDPNARTYMLGMAASLDDAMIERLAAYYAAQKPVSGYAQDPTDIAAGKAIYDQGVPDKILPCMACHGALAEGAGTTPRLAGQHRLSLERQLAYFAANTRTSGTMHQESTNLTDQQIAEVSAYLAALSEGKPSAAAQEGPVTQEQLERMVPVCSSCHEFGGGSTSPDLTFPRLAGQQKDYLSAQLKAFRDKSRADPRARAYMWDRAASLDDAMIERLAAYYAAQRPVSGSAQDPTDAAAGKAIYEQGVPDKVLPCMACHGAEAEGAGTTPRLAGQHRLSLERQLAYFAANTRTGGMMHRESTNLTGQQITDVSAYLAALAEGKPSAAAQEGPVTQEQVERMVPVCSSCHEFRGGSASPDFIFPRIAGQQKNYLSAQLKAFRDKTRADPRARAYMWDRAASLDDAMIERLAAYYAAQRPLSGSAEDLTDVAAGRNIYEQGVPDKILPCMACHGVKAEGAGTTPRLAGQHRLSLERQLAYFAANMRTGGMMHQVSMNLTDQQITDVSAYLAAQSEGKASAAAQAGAVTREQVVGTARACSSCHEFGGGSASPAFVFPRLAGQQKNYLSAQLKAFRDKTRADPRARAYMWEIAAGLGDTMIERLADYYAAQRPLSGSAQNATDVTAGRKIYEQGIPDKIPPCMTCHGAKAEGAGTTPRLAGQYRLSLERQLSYFAANARTGGLMHREAMILTDQQITDVSAYLAAQ